MNDRKFRIGIIGCGGISHAHIQNYLKQPDMEIVAMADLIPGRAQETAGEFGLKGVRFYPSHKELIDSEKDLDGVSVCTYNSQHASCAVYALEHDLPVLLEKPFADTLEEAQRIVEAEKKSKAFVTLGFQPRFDANMQLVKKICESGTLGKIYYIQTGGGRRRGIPGNSSFFRKDTAGIGAMGDIGCYSLDMVLNAIGYPKPVTITGYTSDFFGKNPQYNPLGKEGAEQFGVDDFAAGFIRLEGDIILDFRISWAMHLNTPGDTVIMGTEAALRIPSTDCWNGSVGPLTIYRDELGQRVQTVIPKIDTGEEEWLKLFEMKIRSFLDAIKTGGPAPVPSSQIIYNQAIIDGIYRSAELGREITFEELISRK